MVFRFPEDPSLDYIKRVVAFRDRVVYENKKLSINGVAQPRKQVSDYLNRNGSTTRRSLSSASESITPFSWRAMRRRRSLHRPFPFAKIATTIAKGG